MAQREIEANHNSLNDATSSDTNAETLTLQAKIIYDTDTAKDEIIRAIDRARDILTEELSVNGTP